MYVTAYNPSTDELEKTYLANYIDKAVTTLPVKNSDRFLADRPVLIGRMGDERSEIKTVSAVNSDKIQLTVGPTVFPHNADDPVYLLQYDKIRFYRQDGPDGTPVQMQTFDIDVDNADGVTRWDDVDALTSHYYRVTYLNSVTDEESDYSDAWQLGGFSTNTAGSIIDKVVSRVRDTSMNVLTTDDYLDIMNEVGHDLITQAHRPYRFLKRLAVLDTVAGQNYVEFPEDFWKFNDVSVATISGNYNRFDEVTPLSNEQFNARYDNNQVAPQDNVMDVAIDEENNRLMISPTPRTSQTGVIKLRYWKKFTELTDVGDVIETPNGLIYRYKMMAEFYAAKSETDSGYARLMQTYEAKYGAEIVKMQRANRLDAGSARSMMPDRYRKRRRYHL